MSAIATISSAKLHKKLVPALKGWAEAGGMKIDCRTKKAGITKWLVEHPEAIPEDKLSAFVEKEAGTGNKEPNPSDKEPSPPVVTASDIVEIRSLILDIKEQLADIASRTAAQRPVWWLVIGLGEPQFRDPSPPPHLPHIESIYDDARVIPDAVSEAVLHSRLHVRDFWKLDPTRSKDSHSSFNATGVLANPSDALDPDAEVELAKAKLEYRDIFACSTVDGLSSSLSCHGTRLWEILDWPCHRASATRLSSKSQRLRRTPL